MALLLGCFSAELAGRGACRHRRVAAPAQAVAQPRRGGMARSEVPTRRSAGRVESASWSSNLGATSNEIALSTSDAEAGATAVKSRQSGTVPWWQALPHVANVVTVTSAEDLLQLLRKASTMSKLVAVEYLAGHCSSCRSLAPKLNKMAAEEFQDVLFVKVIVAADHEGNPPPLAQNLAQQLGVDRFPTFQLFRGSAGRVAQFTATMSAEGLDKLRWALKHYSVPLTPIMLPAQKGPAGCFHAPGWPEVDGSRA